MSHITSIASITPIASSPPTSATVIALDQRVADIAPLLTPLADATMLLIPTVGDGLAALVEQLARHAAEHGPIDTLHLVCHGSPGVLELGSGALHTDNLPLHAATLARLRACLAPGAELLLYGCSVAEGEQGRSFMQALAVTTGAHIAAADHPVGQHGGWALNVCTQPLHSPALAAPAYAGQLASFSGKAAGYRFDLVNGVVQVTDIDLSDGDGGMVSLTSSQDLVFADRSYALSLPGPVGEVRVNTTTADDQSGAAITALSGGGYVVTWQSYNQDGSGYGIYAQRYDASGNTLGGEVRVNTTTAYSQKNAAITALSGGGYVVTWQSEDSSYNYDIYAQRYDASGNALGGEVRVNTTTADDQSGAAITALSGGGYVVTWQSYNQDGSGYGIYAQRYDASGNVLGGEVRVNTTTTSGQTNAAITALSGGGYVVTWESLDSVYNYDIYAQRYDASGNALAGEVRVNTTTTNGQSNAAITALSGGGYVVTWQSNGQDSSGYGIYAQRYDASGNALGGEVRVNATTNDSQFDAAITALSDGGYVVTWQSSYQDGSSHDIYAQRYDANGNTLGGEVRVNTTTVDYQSGAAITALSSGGYVLTWQSGRYDKYGIYNNYDIYAQRYNADGRPAGLQISGTTDGEVLTGGSGSQHLLGLAGDDTLLGGAGKDVMTGGLGNDTYEVDSVADVVEETSTLATEVDSVRSSISYTLGANLENLNLLGSASLTGTGNASANQLVGNSGNNTLTGAAGHDTLDGGTGSDRLDGGTGNDLYRVDTSGDTVVEAESAGADTVESSVNYTLGNTLEHLTLTGTAAINATGNALNNLILGNSGNNLLDGKAGADTLTGGSGSDTYVVDNSGDVVQETSSTATDIDAIYASVSWTLGVNTEQLWLTGDNAIDATGNTLNNLLSGNGDENVLNGMGGNDTVSYADALSRVQVSLAETDYQYTQGDGFDQLISIENLIGSNYDDSLTGSAAANVLDGSTGNDTLAGGDGHDSLTGGTGNDSLIGGAGDDSLSGGDGADVLQGGTGNDTYSVGAGDVVIETSTVTGEIDTVVSAGSYRLGANLENLWLHGARHVNGTGNALDNTIWASAGDNVLDGAAGVDHVAYSNATSAVTVSLALTTAQATGGSGTDTLRNMEYLSGSAYADTLTGSSAANRLGGKDGNDTMNGGVGNDTLVGEAGADRLTGGAGNDLFDFNALSELGLGSAARDVITDFAGGYDKIDLSNIDTNSTLAGDQAFKFVNSFTTTAGQVRYAGGIVYLNTDNDTAAEYEIQLTGTAPASLMETSFVL